MVSRLVKCPCEGCICLPICVSKTEINCDILEDYASSTVRNNESINMNLYWEFLHRTLPKLVRIRNDKGVYDL